MVQVKKLPRRRNIYWVVLDPTIGSEIKKTKPAVIVSTTHVIPLAFACWCCR
ncbi:MAG: type II toxin-antitoxin system PemK/MazF family toxin [Nitrospira sp.]